ncbi:hypothetical protein PAEVO_19720 [Paenibacillus sp. GM2FR]|nr:hypothetical protein PAEVO_19720 [Paenibacillus sp. GM2FR]
MFGAALHLGLPLSDAVSNGSEINNKDLIRK